VEFVEKFPQYDDPFSLSTGGIPQSVELGPTSPLMGKLGLQRLISELSVTTRMLLTAYQPLKDSSR